MADISNIGDPAALAEFLRGLDEGGLLAQEIAQQGAVHAIAALLAYGCTEANAATMFSSLRDYAAAIREESARRGHKPLFDKDQTGFQ